MKSYQIKELMNNYSSEKSFLFILILSMLITFSSCKKYLEIKPDQKLTVPETLEDCEALLNNQNVINWSYPSQGEVSSDNFYLTSTVWNTLPITDRGNYIWDSNADVNPGAWTGNYTRILYANQVLETLNKITPTPANQTKWNTIKGRALFSRGFSFYAVAQIFAKPFEATTANQDLGIPIRLSPDLSEKTERGTLKQTYDRILQDLNEAKELLPSVLPTSIVNKTSQPGKVTALAALARIYLDMRDYSNALTNANECLLQYGELLDYNELNRNAAFPIARLNKEVIFQIQALPSAMFTSGLIDPELYGSYQNGDLRRLVFFSAKGNNTYGFKGNYNGTAASLPFMGIATDEIYLIRAECQARLNNPNEAIKDLNILLKKRWDTSPGTSPYIDKTAIDARDALKQVLLERRKELLFRGLRWTDLRRLNKEPDFAKSLTRTIDGQNYTLPPNDLRYVLLIPQDILRNVNIPQNPRR